MAAKDFLALTTPFRVQVSHVLPRVSPTLSFSLGSRNQQISGFVRPEVRAEMSKLTKAHSSTWLTAPAVNLDFARMLYFWHLPPFAFEHKRLMVTHGCDTIQMFQSPEVFSHLQLWVF